MAKLENKTNKIAVVVSFKDRSRKFVEDKIRALIDTFNENFSQYACIIHDKDTIKNEQTGEVTDKTLHVHFIGISTTRRLLTYLNLFACWFEVSTLAVSIEKMSDFTGCFQYLIHKNDLDKFQYSVKDITTNLNETEVEAVLNADLTDMLTTDRLVYVIGTSTTMVEVAQRIGLTMFQHYCKVINVLINNGCPLGFLRLTKDELAVLDTNKG